MCLVLHVEWNNMRTFFKTTIIRFLIQISSTKSTAHTLYVFDVSDSPLVSWEHWQHFHLNWNEFCITFFAMHPLLKTKFQVGWYCGNKYSLATCLSSVLSIYKSKEFVVTWTGHFLWSWSVHQYIGQHLLLIYNVHVSH